MLVGEYPVVYELLHLIDIYHYSAQCIDGCIFPVPDDSEKEMVGRDAVASGSHCLFTGEIDDRVQLV